MGTEHTNADPINTRELRCEKFGLGLTPTAVGSTFTVTNWNEDLGLDCSGDADNAIADVLGTLIRELQVKGIIAGTVAA